MTKTIIECYRRRVLPPGELRCICDVLKATTDDYARRQRPFWHPAPYETDTHSSSEW